jgi:predicted ABC-type ATPase
MSKKIYIVAGCNGAGKTTASYTILPEILDCKEFVNADEIAKGLSPFQPDTVAFEAGRIMLERLDGLLRNNENFAFETTLASKIFAQFISRAIKQGYEITLLFFWLNSKELAVKRVKTRVEEGGHNIPQEVIERRYDRGLLNFYKLYLPLVNNWMFIDNSGTPYKEICQSTNGELEIFDIDKWNRIQKQYGK